MSYISKDIDIGVKLRRHKDNAIFTVKGFIADQWRSVTFTAKVPHKRAETVRVSLQSVLGGLNSGSFSILDEMYDIY